MIATTCLREQLLLLEGAHLLGVLKTISKAQNAGIIQYLQGMTLETRDGLWAHFLE